jgi:hypothetical protein
MFDKSYNGVGNRELDEAFFFFFLKNLIKFWLKVNFRDLIEDVLGLLANNS